MNLTISVDDKLLNRARELAGRRGVSLQELLRAYLESLVGDAPATTVADELEVLFEQHGGHSAGQKIQREDAYEGRL